MLPAKRRNRLSLVLAAATPARGEAAGALCALALRREGMRSSAAFSTSSMCETPTKSIFREISPGISPRSARFRRGRITVEIPERSAARDFSRTPPTGSTRPRRVTSPVMATSGRTGIPVAREVRATAMVIPAEGPSLGIAPAGTWTCTW